MCAPLPSPPPSFHPPHSSMPCPPLPVCGGHGGPGRRRQRAAPRRPLLCGTRAGKGGRVGAGAQSRKRWGGRGHVQDVLQGEHRGLRQGVPGGARDLRRRARTLGPPSRRSGARRARWAPPRGGRGSGGSCRAGMAPVVCGLDVWGLLESLSILTAAGLGSLAAGRRGVGDVAGVTVEGGGGEGGLDPRFRASAGIPDLASSFRNASRTAAASSPEYFFGH